MAEKAVPRSEVPLRVLVCGQPSAAEAIRIAWGGVAEQPLAIEVISADVAAEANGEDGDRPAGGLPEDGLADQVIDALMRNDLGIVPAGLVPDLDVRGSIVSPGNDLLGDGDELGELFPSVESSLVRWGGKSIGIPFGMPQPALLIAETADGVTLPEDQPLEDWDQYLEVARELVARVPGTDGMPVVAEPLAGGDAAKSFLWRASDADPAVWLFDRENFRPTLTEGAYVRTLESMRACAEVYGDRRLTSGEIWTAVADGRIRMAVAWPGLDDETSQVAGLARIAVSDPPGLRSARGGGDVGVRASGRAARFVLADPDAIMGVIGSRCRQTAVAKRFLVWLAGGEGSGSVRRAVPGMTVTRSAAREQSVAFDDPYDRYLSERLQSLQVRPTLRLLGSRRYWQLLDRAVVGCLDGRLSAEEALSEVARQWEELTEIYGRDDQARAWRFAQGLRN